MTALEAQYHREREAEKCKDSQGEEPRQAQQAQQEQEQQQDEKMGSGKMIGTVIAATGCASAAAAALQAQRARNDENQVCENTVTGMNAGNGVVEAEAINSGIGLSTEEARKAMAGAVVVCGRSNRELSERIASVLGIQLGKVKLDRFADGEIDLHFLESLRGKDVYIIQSTSPPVHDNLMELLLMISTARRSSAKKITAVVPYYGYARQDRKLLSRVPISAADVARMIEAMGVDRVISVDLHCGQIQGFFTPNVPVDNLEAQNCGLACFKNKKLQEPIVVSPDAGGVYRARKFQEGLTKLTGDKSIGLAMIIKQRAAANQIEKMELVGSVTGRDAIIVDDMIDTAGTLCEAAKLLKGHGAKRIYAFATHGLFSKPAMTRIDASPLEEVVVSDSIKRDADPSDPIPSKKIIRMSISELLATAILRVHKKESIHNIFYDD